MPKPCSAVANPSHPRCPGCMRSLGTRTTKNRMNFTYSATCQDSSFGTDTNPGWHGLHHPLTLRPRPQSKETAHDRYQQKSTQLTQKSQDKCAISKGLLDARPAPATFLPSKNIAFRGGASICRNSIKPQGASCRTSQCGGTAPGRCKSLAEDRQ